MRSIFKYPIQITDVQTLSMPEAAEILTVQIQDGVPCLWAIVDTQVVNQERVIEVFGTGRPLHQDMGISRVYIGTVQERPFVWHVFERIN
jgi:hypothetical protein